MCVCARMYVYTKNKANKQTKLDFIQVKILGKLDSLNVKNLLLIITKVDEEVLLFLIHVVVSLCNPVNCSTPGFPVLHHL